MAYYGRDPAPSQEELKKRTSRRRRRREPHPCPLCADVVAFTWQCRCGFEMCQSCMDDNSWGVTCNNITWVCPECGEANSY